MKKESKYYYYEKAVQEPEADVEFFDETYQEVRGKQAHTLREDFCGTFRISCEWVRYDEDNTAYGLDLDSEPLMYGRHHNLTKLTEDEQKRIHILQQNVLSVTNPKSDLIVACNFSICFFKRRTQLVEYFRYALQSLDKDGLFILDLVGGTDMQKAHKESTKHGRGQGEWVYYWEGGEFNPINNEAEYAIHLRLPSGRRIKRAFTYDWRIWTIPEIREALDEAGFSRSIVYWEGDDGQGGGNGEFSATENGENCRVWICYIAGVK